MEEKKPSPQTTLLILLGASEWPMFPLLPSSKAFANAAQTLKAYFLNPRGFGLPAENLLDLFDSEKYAGELDEEISQFLERRLIDLKKAGNSATDVILYFVGHGGFIGPDADFYLAIRLTRIGNPRSSGLQVTALADTLKDSARLLRRIVILDCCFAAAAFSAFQGVKDDLVFKKTNSAFQKGGKSFGFPTKGTTLLCSSSSKSPSRILPGGESTMFTNAFLVALTQGTTSPDDHLTLREVKDVTAELLTEIPDAPRPVMHSPDQSEGDIADIPFFPNPCTNEYLEKMKPNPHANEYFGKARQIVDKYLKRDISILETDFSHAVPELKKLIASKLDYKNIEEWTTSIQEVPIGNTSADGGTRGKQVMLGGEKALPFFPDALMPNRNQVTIDVFDMRIGLANAVKENYDEVMDNPGEWAEKSVNKFNADMITINLISTDPLVKDTPAKEAAKTVEEVLQAVDVPIVIGGSGNPQKDVEVLSKAAEVAEGERCLIASASLNLDFAKIAEAAIKYDHDVLSWTQLDMNAQKELNRKLMKQCNVPRDRIIMDTTTAALGYGLDYAYTNMERIRLAALMGDEELTFPMSSGTTVAWGARESWMVSSPLKKDSDWGPRKYRGPIWEIITGLSLALAGNDLFMMMHPTSVVILKHFTQTLFGIVEAEPIDLANWIRLGSTVPNYL